MIIVYIALASLALGGIVGLIIGLVIRNADRQLPSASRAPQPGRRTLSAHQG